MQIPRLFCPALDLSITTITLPDNVVRHAVQVLRLKEGASIKLFDGHGIECEAKLINVSRRAADATVGKQIISANESPLNITLLQAVSRGERMDYAVQKAVELGVTRIIPIQTERCNVPLSDERALKKWSHWQGVMISACEQSGRSIIPELNETVGLEDALKYGDKSTRLVLNPLAENGFMAANKSEKITLLIGPEGGLTEEELMMAQKASFESVRFGPRILRTETATVAVLAVIQTLWGDMG